MFLIPFPIFLFCSAVFDAYAKDSGLRDAWTNAATSLAIAARVASTHHRYLQDTISIIRGVSIAFVGIEVTPGSACRLLHVKGSTRETGENHTMDFFF